MTTALVPSTTEDFIAEELAPCIDHRRYWAAQAAAHRVMVEACHLYAQAERINLNDKKEAMHLKAASDYSRAAQQAQEWSDVEISS